MVRRFIIAAVGAIVIAFCVASPACATGENECITDCRPGFWLERLDDAYVRGQEGKIVFNLFSTLSAGSYSLVMDCSYTDPSTGQSGVQDGHVEQNNIEIPSNAHRQIVVEWTPWEPGRHDCTARIYKNPGGCYMGSNPNPLHVNVLENACSECPAWCDTPSSGSADGFAADCRLMRGGVEECREKGLRCAKLCGW